jgi:hypothetical protein
MQSGRERARQGGGVSDCPWCMLGSVKRELRRVERGGGGGGVCVCVWGGGGVRLPLVHWCGVKMGVERWWGCERAQLSLVHWCGVL